MKHKNKPQVNDTYQSQIDSIRSIDDYDIEKVESLILQKKQLLKNCKDTQKTERLLAELEALEWLQAQIVVLALEGNHEADGDIRYQFVDRSVYLVYGRRSVVAFL